MHKKDVPLPTPTGLFASYLNQFDTKDIAQYYAAGLRFPDDRLCACCGKTINAGQICHSSEFVPITFTDTKWIKGNGQGSAICSDCKMAICYAPASMQFSYSAIGTDPNDAHRLVAYNTLSSEDLIASIFNPPKPPFMLVRKERKRQHMIFKGVVNIHDASVHDTLFYTSGERLLIAHPRWVKHLLEEEIELLSEIASHVSSKKRCKPPKGLLNNRLLTADRDYPELRLVDYRSDRYGISDADLLDRIQQWSQQIAQLTVGDIHVLANLKYLFIVKKAKSYDELLSGLVRRDVDINSILYGRPPQPNQEQTKGEQE